MPETEDDQFTTFRIAQEVAKSPALQRFSEKVREIGRLAFPAEATALLPIELLSEEEQAELLQPDEFGPPILAQASVDVSRLTVYRNLEVPLLERAVPRDMNYVGSFSRTASKLSEKNRPVANPIRRDAGGTVIQTRTHSIHGELEKAALQYDGLVGPDKPVRFSSVTWYVNPFRRFLEAALVPDADSPATMLWVDQAKLCHQALAGISKKAAYPTQNIAPVVAFARIPQNATVSEKQRFIKKVQQILPVYLPFGGITLDLDHRQSM